MSFGLVTDRETGNSKGYGFFVATERHGRRHAGPARHADGEKTLTVRRATGERLLTDRRRGGAFGDDAFTAAAPGVVAQPLDPASLQAQRMAHLAGGGAAAAATGAPPPPSSNPPSAVVSLGGMLDAEGAPRRRATADIEEDMREELGKFGALVEMVIPRPGAAGVSVPGLGRVFARFADETGATAARTALHGRKFGGEPSPPISSTSTFERRAF